MNIDEKLRVSMDSLTSSERKAAVAMLADYPFAGLLTLAELSKRAKVSTQTILRLAAKIGFDGYPGFQQALIGEIKEAYQSPISLREVRGSGDQGKDFLSGLTVASIEAIRETMANISRDQFEKVSRMIAEPRHSVFLIGGRITRTIAAYFYRHLNEIRPKIFMVPESHEAWPDYLLRMSRNDVVILFDFRRYQPDLESFAHYAVKDCKAKLILITDKWLSPVSQYSTHIFPCMIDVQTPWDSSAAALILVEAFINRVADSDWAKTRERINKWDMIRDFHNQMNTAEKTKS